MRLASFRVHGVPGYGLVTDEGLRPVPTPVAGRYPDLRSALAAGALRQVADAAAANPWCFGLDEVVFEPPIPDPGKILCVGINYLAHIHEMGREPPEYPVLFVRFPETLTGHGRPLRRPSVSTQYDFEGELAVVIGRSARYLKPEEALDHVAGYACLMDGSLRDFQRQTSQFTSGKNFPSSGAFGPWLVTADELPDPAVLKLETRLNGEIMQQAPVSDMRFGVAELVAYASTVMQLEAGDIISTGTPSGVGFARQPPLWLKPGDVVEVEIGGIGVLRNEVVDEA